MFVSLLLIICGLLFIGYSLLVFVKRRRILLSGTSGFLGLVFTMAGGLVTLLLLNVQTYQQLTREIDLTEVVIGQDTGSGIPVTLDTAGGRRTYTVNSSEWRLDARFIKWKPWITLLGKAPIVRLERFAERDADPVESLKQFDLSINNRWLDTVVSEVSGQVGLIDSIYGSSVYMPVTSGARYKVSATVSGLVARPVNSKAKQAVLEWSHL